MNEKPLLSFVIPCYRSEETIKFVVDELIRTVSERPEYDYEIIAVNDSSPDHVLDILKNLAGENPRMTVVDCALNRGKAAALMAGFSLSHGDYVICLDDDGQSPVYELWRLLGVIIEDDYDIAVAKYPVKKENWWKRCGSRINDMMMSVVLNKPKEFKAGNFFAFKRFVCTEMLRYKNPYPYIPGLYLRASNRVKNVTMEERERMDNKKTGYTFWRSVALWLNGFTAFSVKPLRIATIMGMAASGFGILFSILIVLRKIMNPEIQAGYSSVMAALLLIGGCILFSLGMLGEYIGRIYISLNNSPQYVIRDIFHMDENEDGTLGKGNGGG